MTYPHLQSLMTITYSNIKKHYNVKIILFSFLKSFFTSTIIIPCNAAIEMEKCRFWNRFLQT